jgi:hypothetical protein
MRFLVGILLIGVVVVFGLTVWPTVWNERTASISGRSVQVRSHRINGSMELLTSVGWRKIRNTSSDLTNVTPGTCPTVTRAEWQNDPFLQRYCIEPK